MIVDPDKVARIIRDVTETEILPRFKTLRRDQIHEKRPNQLVTEADTEAERALAPRLLELVSGTVVGEEGVEKDPSVFDSLGKDGAVWVIDPVDGTANFANNNPRFAVVVALVIDTVTRIGWIHDPVANRTVIAERGQGAWRDGARLRVAGEVELNHMVGSVRRKGRIADNVLHVNRRGSAAHDYLDLATGQLHFAHFRRLYPWDHAAGVLIHAEAGGTGRLIGGNSYTPIFHPDAQILLAPGERSWARLAGLID